jgi:hypothetical protein
LSVLLLGNGDIASCVVETDEKECRVARDEADDD